MTDNEIILFRHEEFGEIRTLNIDGELLYFCALDEVHRHNDNR